MKPFRAWPLAGAAAAALLLSSCAGFGGAGLLRQADSATGAAGIKTLRFTASGTGGIFGQAFRSNTEWPKLNYSSLSRTLDYENGAMREDFARSRAEAAGGGALPLMGQGEQRGTGFVRGTWSWNLAGPAPVAAPVALDARLHDLWTSPHGVIKAAQRNNATVVEEGGRQVLSFTEPGRFTAKVWIDKDGFVEKVEAVQPNAVLGDVKVSTFYLDWRDFNGVKFPGRILQNQAGHPVLDVRVTEVQANAPAGIEVPALVTQFTERVVTEKVADGVWFLAGGSHNSVLIDMGDHLMLVESPLYDGRAQAVLAEAKKLAPGKPVRYVVNTHHHFDHAGGLRAAAAEGATLVVPVHARRTFEMVLANPNTVAPDALARSGRKPVVEGVSGMRSFGEGKRKVELRLLEGSQHAQGFMVAWLPEERLLIEADAYTPGAPGAPAPAVPNENNVNLANNIARWNLNVDRILPLHGRVVPVSELYTAIGRPR